jgi:hypothetical protein
MLGRTYPGGLSAFVAAMNAKAQMLGMHDSRFADPLLRDREHPERGVRPGSPAHDLGFHDIDLRGLGPRVVVGTRGRGVPADVEIPAAGR